MSTTSPVDMVIQLIAQIPAMLMTTTAGMFWIIISTVWLSLWPYITVGMILWVIFELITRNEGIHYNSDNGFSPTFNRVVGSGVLLLFQAGIYAAITKIFGHEVYLLRMWPYPIHIAGFLLTGLFLNLVGFWVYWKLPRF